MAGSSIVGQLRVILGLDQAQYLKGLTDAQKELRKFGRDMSKLGGNIADIGKSMTVGITAPLAAMGAGIITMSGNFEKAMNDVSIATQATAGEMKAMNDQALELGKSSVFSASEAAGAMEMLAKNGVSTKDILSGAAKAALDLAAAAGSELEPAAAAVSDTFQQFHLSTADLPDIINQITGAVNESKLSFEDFQLASAQAGGVAGSLGVSFHDFNTVLAATSSLFSSGSDAGTSFKTFLVNLVPKSDAAAAAMEKYGLKFFDAAGKMKTMSDIAGMLQEKLAGLSDEAKNEVLKEIFGVDAMRTAVGLMNQGADGLDKIAAKIAATDAAAQSAQRMKGFWSQMEQLGGALETLAIKIGQAGLLAGITALVGHVIDLVDWMSKASPEILNFAVVFGIIAAAIGPVLIIVGALISSVGTIAGVITPLLPVLGEAGLAGAFSAAASAAAPFVAIAAFIALEWDKIGPVLAGLWKQIQETLGPRLMELIHTVSAALSELWNGPLGSAIKIVIDFLGILAAAFLQGFGEVLIRLLTAAVSAITAAFKIISGTIKFLAALVTGDWSGAWKAANGVIIAAVNGVIAIIGDLAGYAPKQIAAMVTSIKDWIVGKLGATWDWLTGKIKSVADAFKWLDDVVVRHSYVPDMVISIGKHIGRLSGLMVKPVMEMTAQVAGAFEKMAGTAVGGMNWKGPVLNEKPFDKTAQDVTRAATINVAKASEDMRDRTVTAWEDMANGILNAMDRLLGSLKGGGVLDILSAGIGLFSQVSATGIFGRASPTKSGESNKVPGFKTGGSFRVGGMSGVDRNLVQFRATRNEVVDIHKPGNDNGPVGSSKTYVFKGNLMTPEFWSAIQAGDAQAATEGSMGAQVALVRRRAKTIP